nr:hypothetical protein Ade03nite_24560 [Actinoplanes derwentensis]
MLTGRLTTLGWYLVAAGDTLVATEHDTPGRDCAVTVTAVDGRTGTSAWNGTLYSRLRADGECQKTLGRPYDGGPVLFGSGSAVASVTRTGRTTLTDVTTGTVRWTADQAGTPIAGDDRRLLVRDNAESGPVALLDLADGRRLWTVPDPGLPGTSASWDSAVAGDLVAVMGATGDRPYVQIHDAATGRQLARRGGWLTGLGDGWAMVSTSVDAAAGRLTLHMLRF